MSIAHVHFLSNKHPKLLEFAQAVQAGLESDKRAYVRTKDGPANEMRLCIVDAATSKAIDLPQGFEGPLKDFPGISQYEPGLFVWTEPRPVEKAKPPKVRGRKLKS